MQAVCTSHAHILVEDTILDWALDQGSANFGPWAKSSLSSVFVNNILPEKTHVHWFTYCLSGNSHYNGRVE